MFSLLLACLAAHAQTADSTTVPIDTTPTLTVRSTLVQVPALVKTKKGELVFTLTAKDFALTDNGVPQTLRLDEDTDSQPLALAIVVETGGSGATHLEDYKELEPVIDAVIGNVTHRVAVIGFDSQPHLLQGFTSKTADAADELQNLEPGDRGAAIRDAIAFAVRALAKEPPRYRRAVLLLSETIDQGSRVSLNDTLRLISDTNTTMYSFGFNSTRAEIRHEASKLSSDEPGPVHGCFGKEGADPEYEGHYSKQVLDCLSQLAPPLRLATIAFVAARNGLRKNTAESIANLTGGEYWKFHDAKSLQRELLTASNDVPNHYVLSFRPTDPTPGLHALHMDLVDRPQLELKSRAEYWLDDGAAR